MKPILLLLSCSEQQQALQVLHDVFGQLDSTAHGRYEWPVSTKYYTADVEVCPIDRDVSPSNAVLDAIEALLVYYDPQEDEIESMVGTKLNSVPLPEMEVKVLAVKKFTAEAKSNRDAVQNWCLDKGYEMVELFPEEYEEEDEDVIGPQRVRKALEVHTWSNLKKKVPNGDAGAGVLDSHPGLGILDDMGDFENLFNSFAEMKEEAAKLPPSERKAYAEKVAIAFWKAMNLDEDGDDLDGLDDSEESDNDILNEILDSAPYAVLSNEKE